MVYEEHPILLYRRHRTVVAYRKTHFEASGADPGGAPGARAPP